MHAEVFTTRFSVGSSTASESGSSAAAAFLPLPRRLVLALAQTLQLVLGRILRHCPLKEKLALLNSRYVSKGEKQEKQDLEDRAAIQEAVLLSEEVTRDMATPTNGSWKRIKGLARYIAGCRRIVWNVY